MSAGASETKLPEVPGVWRLMWLLFMQPIKLHHMFKAWGLEGDPSLWKLRRRIFEGDPNVRTLVWRLLVMLVLIGPSVAIAVSGVLSVFISVNWGGVALGVALGLVVSVALGVTYQMAYGVAFGVAFGVTFGVALGLALGLAAGVAVGVAYGLAVGAALGLVLGVAGGVSEGVPVGVPVGVPFGVTFGVAFGVALGMSVGVVVGVAFGVAFGVSTITFTLRILFFAFEAIATQFLSRLTSNPTIARWLPHRHHDLIHFPLPGLHRIFTSIGLRDPLLARQLIDEAAATIAQGKPAQRALRELQAHVLDKAARDGQWSIIANLQSPFFPLPEDLRPEESLAAFVAAAKDVTAADTGGSQHRRRNLLESARARMDSFTLTRALRANDDSRANENDEGDQDIDQYFIESLAKVLNAPENARMTALRAGFPRSRIPPFQGPLAFWSKVVEEARNGAMRGGVATIVDAAAEQYPSNPAFAEYRKKLSPKRSVPPTARPTDRHEHPPVRLHMVAQQWFSAITTKLDALQRTIAGSPEIPAVYVIGSPLDPTNPDEVALFRVRPDLVAIIDRDLDDDRRGPLLLTGQRRMGKTSLLRMLPAHLGAATIISSIDFQRLSGSPFRQAPHRILVQRLASDLAHVPNLVLPPVDTVTDAWDTALDWLRDVDTALARAHHRVLITIDEIESLQDGANAGWSDLTFLDFVRAAGDALRRIRLLLVSAHQLTSPRLGPKWPARLISAYPCHLGPLPREAAEPLLRKPVHYFPDTVFDDAAVATVLAQTGGHPYLIQLVGNEVVKRLNGSTPRRTTATPQDIDRALDHATTLARGVFSDLWQDFDDTDRTLLCTLAHDQPIDPNTPTFRNLRDQSFVELHADDTPAFVFPLFARWIRDYQS